MADQQSIWKCFAMQDLLMVKKVANTFNFYIEKVYIHVSKRSLSLGLYYEERFRIRQLAFLIRSSINFGLKSESFNYMYRPIAITIYIGLYNYLLRSVLDKLKIGQSPCLTIAKVKECKKRPSCKHLHAWFSVWQED